MGDLRFNRNIDSSQLYWLCALAMLSLLLAIGEANISAIAKLRQALSYPLAPLVWVRQQSIEQYLRVNQWGQRSSQLQQLELAYGQLQAANQLLRQRNSQLDLENDELRTLSGLAASLQLSGTGAQVTGLRDRLRDFSISLNKGSLAGLTVDSVVLSKNGVIGQIDNLGPNFSQVIPITSRRHHLPVRLGLNQGYYNARGLGDALHLNIDRVSQDANINVGDWVYTSGLGKRFPPGLIVGRISAITPISNETFDQVRIEATSATAMARFVLVLDN